MRGLVLGAAIALVIFIGASEIRQFRAEPPLETARPMPAAPVQERVSSLHQVRFERLPSAPNRGSGGALSHVDNRIILATRAGAFQVLGDDGFASLDVPQPWPSGAFDGVFTRPVDVNSMGLKGLAIEPVDGGIRMFSAHNYVRKESGNEPCIGLAVSSLNLTADLAPEGRWRSLFETEPCLPPGQAFPLQSGGALVLDGDGGLIVTVGDFGNDGSPTSEPLYPQDPDADYGKTVEIDLETGATRRLTLGHRNPAGIARIHDGAILVSEHGPRGGDELNIIVSGANFGWPHETYGTGYSDFTWPLDPTPGRHDDHVRPLFAFAPSIGISQLIAYDGASFPNWRGNVLVASLKNGGLFRLVIEEARVILAERIEVEARVRDIVADKAGDIFLLLDESDTVLKLSNAMAGSDAMTIPQGLSFCASCHIVGPGLGADGPGPTLIGVVGREVASVPGYRYSPALARLTGAWTREALLAYLLNTNAIAPAGAMPQLDISPAGARGAVNALIHLSR